MDFLSTHELADIHRREFVVCANSEDRDFPPRVRDCPGNILLRDGADEAGHEYRCPECNRPVFPDGGKKKRFVECRVAIRQEGVMQFLSRLLSSAKLGHQNKCEGVLEVDTDKGRTTLCVVDYCVNDQVLAREWAMMNPTLYITVGPKEQDWLLAEAWLKYLPLADVVSEGTDLAVALLNTAATGTPSNISAASIPVYTKGARPIHFEPMETVHADRRFAVSVGPETVVINGMTVIYKQATTRLIIFNILWRRFLDNLQYGHEPDDFPPMTLYDLANEVAEKTKKEVEDIESIRRGVNRIQSDIKDTIKKNTGAPISGGDIIQTIASQGKDDPDSGYRINPISVMARIFSTVTQDLSE
ncbi:MAG: hypothetical protein CMJ96_08680 [Planctomycetes bacterium]|nr:hypothetical protein [Planctomycetota bacterium]